MWWKHGVLQIFKGFSPERRVHLGYSPIEVTEISSTPDKEAPFKILNLPRHHTG